MPLSVVILTFNAERTIGATLASAARVSDDIHVVDSGSTDGTLAIVAASGATLARHPFESYGAQRNWAIDNLTPYVPTADQTVDLTGGGRSLFLAAFNPNYTAQIIAASVNVKW